ncbi:MAG: hypothetical protein ACLGIN_10570 [Candidatus Sericytochromatia bacterium]
MPDITIVDIMSKLVEHVEQEEAELLLAAALEKLDLPVRELYSPGEVMAIGAEIADFNRSALAESDIPEARELEKVVGPLIDAIKEDQPQLPPEE